MIKEINTDRFLDGIQIKTNTIKEATGVAFKIATGSAKISRTNFTLYASAESINPKKTAQKKPIAILSKENQIAFQKAGVCTNEMRHRPAERGDASNICLSNAMLANCQSNSQNAMVQSFILFFFLVCVVVEIIIW